MPVVQKPILHGRDHCPGGADPIPCLQSGAGDYPSTVAGLSGLLGYWRLGETSGPWADTSGTEPPADLTSAHSGTAPSPGVTGALASGDDGAFELNYDGSEPPGAGGPLLVWTDDDTRFRLPQLTAAAWVKVKASSATRHGPIIGNTVQIFASPDYINGWALEAIYPSRNLHFTFGQTAGGGTAEVYVSTSGGVAANEWVHVAGTYDAVTMRLYVDGVLVDEHAIPSYLGDPGVIRLGAGVNPINTSSWFYGTIDEAAIWSRALSGSEIETLYESGVGGAAAGSKVLLSDGAGGFSWGQVGSDAIADDAVTSAKVAADSITSAKILDGAIVDADVATAADIDPTKLEHPGGTSSFLRADGTWATPSSTPSDPADDTAWWAPLVDSDGTCVLDGGGNLIPTLLPI